MDKIEFICLHVDSRGERLERNARKPIYPFDRRWTMLLYDGSLFAPLDVFVEMAGTSLILTNAPCLHWHGRQYFLVTSEELSERRKSNAYPRRSERERAVQARRERVMDLVESLTSELD